MNAVDGLKRRERMKGGGGEAGYRVEEGCEGSVGIVVLELGESIGSRGGGEGEDE